MTFPPASLRRIAASLLLAIAVPCLTASDLKFTTPDTLSTEALTLVRLLEQAHYNRDAVHSSDYGQVVPEFMKALDGQHLFFLDSDREDFANRFGKNVYYNVDYLGKIDSAYDIFYVYDDRVTARVAWIMGELKKKMDFTTPDNFRVDRSDSPWPSTTAEADELWRKRLKFEVLAELLNKKTLDQGPRGRAALRAHAQGRRRDRGQRAGRALPRLRRRPLRPPLHVLLGRHLRGFRHPDEAQAGRHRRHARPG